MTKPRNISNQHKSVYITDSIKERLLHVPMVRLDYTVKDTPYEGASIPKSVRVCDINHVRYLMSRDVKIGEGSGLIGSIHSREWFRRQCLHVYNPYMKIIVSLIPQRIFEDHAEDVFEPKMIVHPEWEKEFRRLVEVTGIGEIPKAYQYVFDPYMVTEGEKAYLEWKAENKAIKEETGQRPKRVYQRKKGGAA